MTVNDIFARIRCFVFLSLSLAAHRRRQYLESIEYGIILSFTYNEANNDDGDESTQWAMGEIRNEK